MSEEERGLLAAIAETPEDDAPRLVYADWLQSRADPRGELIQLQCQLAAAPDDERRRAIRIRENKLLAAHAAAWRGPVEAIVPDDQRHACKFELARGFVASATITLACVPHLEDLFAAAPLIRHLRIVPTSQFDLTGFGSKLERPAVPDLSSPLFARLRSLDLSLPGAANPLAMAVANAPMLRGLRELRLAGSVWGEAINFYRVASWKDLILDDDGAIALAASPHLAGLVRLDLEANRLGVAGIDALGNGPWRLSELVLAQNWLELGANGDRARVDAFAHAFAGPGLQELEVLALASNALSPAAIAAVVRGPHLAKLRELDLERCHLGAAGTAALCDALALPALRRLRLERNSLGDAGTIAVAGCAGLANLTSLEAGHNRIGQKGAVALASSPYLAKLERLTLNEPRWKPETAAMLAGAPALANTRIYLAGKLVAKQAKLAAAAANAERDVKRTRGRAVASPGAVAREPAGVASKPASPSKRRPAPKSASELKPTPKPARRRARK